MANTRRKTNSFPITGQESLLVFLDGKSNHNKSRYLGCQGCSEAILGAFELLVPVIAVAAKTAVALHAQYGGSTVSVSDGNMAGLSRFAVSIYPERTVELTVAPTWEVLFAFAVINADLLLLPNHAIGTWFDTKRNLHILDVVVCPSSREEATRLGMCHRQEAIYDLQAGREIPLATSRDIPPIPFDDKEH